MTGQGVSTEYLVFNGVHGETGEYLRPPVRFDQLAQRFAPRVKRRRPVPRRAPVAAVDPRELDQSGWGVLFAPGVPPEVLEALRPLLHHRQSQATREDETFYRECEVLPGETSASFLRRHGKGPGPADPAKMPYYLLIVGDPEQIPYDFQHQLDVQYAVGRLGFDTPEEYARYAESVVAAETRPAVLSRQIALFGPRNHGDPLTVLSSEQLLQPLACKLAAKRNGWNLRTCLGEEATKASLARLLGNGGEAPALLFTASHGLGFYPDDERQRDAQGALLCQEWVKTDPSTVRKSFFSARDVADDAQLQGRIAFFFACYSAGTPQWDSFSHLEAGASKKVAAPRAFVARLPQRLLGHPRGGALAVIGHVDQAWPCSSFLWQDAGPQLQVFESALSLLMAGYPVGAAMEYFGQRYAEIAAELSARLEPVVGTEAADDLDLTALWLARNDARGYAVCGDPAVRLNVAGEAG